MNFQNKKVTIMGLGVYQDGSGISATRFLVEQGARVTVTDLKNESQLAGQIKKLKKFIAQKRRQNSQIKPVKFVLGEHRQADFVKADLIVRNPGVPNTSKYLMLARQKNIPIETDISLFFQLVPKSRLVAITGTRGKSTTTTLIWEILKNLDRNAVLGGNITVSPLAQMAKVKRGGPVVLELSSWLTESLEPRRLASHIAVVTNIYPDHLNTYTNLKDYASAKEQIFRWQNLQDYVVLNRDNKWTRDMGRRAPSKRFWFSLTEFPEENGCFVRARHIFCRLDGQETKILDIKSIKLLGEHNIANILAAVCVGMIAGVSATNIARVVKNFRGVPNRLELLRELKGVKYYNDTTSTTPEATIAALKALAPASRKSKVESRKSIVLIAGGSDKGLDFRELVKEVKNTCKAVILLKGTGTERIKKLFGFRISDFEFGEVNSMSDAVKTARLMAKKGDIILLSPACASFGLFINEYDRGDQFKKIVSKLK